jgi:hypothetical protein
MGVFCSGKATALLLIAALLLVIVGALLLLTGGGVARVDVAPVDADAAVVPVVPVSVLDFKLLGSCSFNNQWTGSLSLSSSHPKPTTTTCVEFRGDEAVRDIDQLTERCEVESESTFSEEACPAPSDNQLQAGWCITNTVYFSAVDDGVNDVAVAIEASAMMITNIAPDCSTNKMACETIIGGTFEAVVDASKPGCDILDAVVESSTGIGIDTEEEEEEEEDEEEEEGEEEEEEEEEGTSSTTSATTTQSMCDESLTAPVILPCTNQAKLKLFNNGSYVGCGDLLSVEEAATVPTIRVDNTINIFDSIIDDPDSNALYTLILVDTTDPSPVHPILHYGAVNIPGALLLAGFSLDNNSDNSDVNIFSDYRGPTTPNKDDFWWTPENEKKLFVYEYMLSLQPNKIEIEESTVSTVGFDYEKFFEETIGITSSFGNNSNNIMSTNFLLGRCVGVDGVVVADEDNDIAIVTTKTTTGGD